MTRASVGEVRHVRDRIVSGSALPADAPASWIEFRVGERIVGRTDPLRPDAEGGPTFFKAVIDAEDGASVHAVRMPDEAPLDGSPFTLDRPQPAAELEASAATARFALPKPLRIEGRDVALLVTRSRSGVLRPNVPELLRLLDAQGLATLLVAMVDRPIDLPAQIVDLVAGVLVRPLSGGPFAGWAQALALYPEAYGAGLMVLMTDALIPSRDEQRFAEMIDRARHHPADLVAATASHEGIWHLQSHVLALKHPLLDVVPLQDFFDGVPDAGDWEASRAREEIRFSAAVTGAGFSAEALYATQTARDPTVHAWRALIDAGCPLVRPMLPGRDLPEDDLADWLEALDGNGFDPATIEAMLRARNEETDTSAADLLARPVRLESDGDAPIKVRFYGEWNRRTAAGALARRVIGGLRRGGAAVALLHTHPISGPSTPIGPTSPIADFLGPADVAIVQGPPDRWDALLTVDQQHEVHAARRRIALIGDAPDGVPAAWRDEASAVDLYWTSRQDTADHLSADGDVAVEVLAYGGEAEAGAPVDFAALGEAIAASLAATLAATPTPAFARLRPSLLAGWAFGDRPLGDGIHAAPLARDGAPAAGSSGSSAAIAPGGADWIVFAPEGSIVYPLLGSVLREQAERRPDAAIFYADDVARKTEEAIDQVRLKPELDLALLAAQDYVGAPVMIRAAALDRLGGLAPRHGTAAIGDLLFRAHAEDLAVARIPEVLLAYPGRRMRAVPEEYRAMVAAQPRHAGHDVAAARAPGGFTLRRRFADGAFPPVTLVVPTRQAPHPASGEPYLAHLLAGIAEVDWPHDRLTVLVGDDLSGEPAWAAVRWPFTLTRVATPRAPSEPFNYAAKMNRLWRSARTEQIVFLNDDLLPSSPGWLKALQTFALDPAVGGVGGRLLFADGRLQHAGMAPRAGGTGHVWFGRRRERGTYQDWALLHREWSMLTGALFATRRAILEETGGYDERFSLEFNDADLCLRLRSLGYRLVCTPDAEMVHAEKASRGEALPPGPELALFRRRWREWWPADPSWHPALERDRTDMMPRIEGTEWFL